jgi:hypothetical protein
MNFVRRLLGSVSSIALFLSGVSGATANVPVDNPEFATQPSSIADFDKSRRTGDLLVELILGKGQLTEQSIETNLQYMLIGLTPEQAAKLPLLMRDLRTLGLRPEIEVAAAEALIRIVGKASGTVLTTNQAKLLVGDIFDQFVKPTKFAINSNPPARPVGGRTIHDIQLAQEAGISAPEQLETLRPLMAPEELETQFEPGAGYQL